MPPSAPSYSGVRRSKRICARKKLPISKSFEEDDEAGKLDKAEEIVGVVLPANEDPALPLNPGEEPLDEPARLHQDSARAAPPMPVAKPPKAATSNLRRVVGVRDPAGRDEGPR